MNEQHFSQPKRHWLSCFLPTPGNVIFTLLVVTLAFWAQSAGALPGAGTTAAPQQASSDTIPYQGRLVSTSNEPLTGQYTMGFRIYDVPTGGTPLWEEFWIGSDSVQVSDGLFNVMLGSINNTLASAIAGHDELYLGVTVSTDGEMSPRTQLGSVPFAMQALTVPDGAITQEQAAFAPLVYHGASLESVDKPIIYSGWFHGSDEGYATYDLSDIFSEIDGVMVTKTRSTGGVNTLVVFKVTDGAGTGTPKPSDIKIWAHDLNGNSAQWIQAYFVVIGR